MSRLLPTLLALLLALAPDAAQAGGYTETLPASTFMVDVGYVYSTLKYRYDDNGDKTQLIDNLYRYDPGGGLQGVVIADADVNFEIVVPQLRYGVFDFLTLVVGVPVVRRSRVSPNLGWESGDYQWTMGRSFSEQDFWSWASTMDQPKPGTWEGNHGVLGDVILAARYRFSDHIAVLGEHGVHLAVQVLGALPTGTQKDPEEVVATGTTSWDLHSQGELGVHLSLDKTFEQSLDGRLTLGLDLFYEALFEHTYTTPTGSKNPLILTAAPYAGDTYTLDPGDFMGFGLHLGLVPIKGPAFASWISGHSASRAAQFPPLLAINLDYTFIGLGQSDWTSESALWDWTNEKLWLPGYKNALKLQAVFSFMRLGTPLQAYVSYKALSLIPGRNSRATDVLTVGLRAPLKFW